MTTSSVGEEKRRQSAATLGSSGRDGLGDVQGVDDGVIVGFAGVRVGEGGIGGPQVDPNVNRHAFLNIVPDCVLANGPALCVRS